MPEHLKALVVILGLSWPTFVLGRRMFAGTLIADADFTRRRNLWFAVTLIAFLAHNFWIYVVVTMVVLLISRSREHNPVALYLLLLFAVPPMQELIPGLGVFGHVFAMDHLRLLTLAILLPGVMSSLSDPDRIRFGRTAADKFLIAFLLLQMAFQFVLSSWTGAVRASFYLFIDVLLPYYAASRLLRDSRMVKEAVGSLVLALLLLTPIALFEFTRHWLLYSALDRALGVHWGFGSYLGRDDSLRALATAGHSIALGYLLAVGLCLYVFASTVLPRASWRLGGWALLSSALFVTLSRGPWVGAALWRSMT